MTPRPPTSPVQHDLVENSDQAWRVGLGEDRLPAQLAVPFEFRASKLPECGRRVVVTGEGVELLAARCRQPGRPRLG